MSNGNGIECRKARQISVFLEDKPGTLGRVCRLLGDAGVNIWALTLAEGIDHGYVRMVTDAPDRALEVLRAEGHLFFEKDVLLLELTNTPGGLGGIAERWGAGGVNIEYCYCASSPRVAVGLVVVRVNDIAKAVRLLEPA